MYHSRFESWSSINPLFKFKFRYEEFLNRTREVLRRTPDW